MVGTAAIAVGMAATSGGAYLVLAKMYGWWPFAPVVAKVETSMVVTTSPPSEVGVSQGFTFAGRLEDTNGNALANKQIDLYVGGIVSSSTTTGANGGWAFELTAPSEGTMSLYTEFPGDEQYEGC